MGEGDGGGGGAGGEAVAEVEAAVSKKLTIRPHFICISRFYCVSGRGTSPEYGGGSMTPP